MKALDKIAPVRALELRTKLAEHIHNQDPISVDSGLVDATRGVTVSVVDNVAEDRANSGAASALVSTTEIESFIRRVAPLYAGERVVQFANRIKIYPGLFGQLQHRRELGYMASRDFLVKKSATSLRLNSHRWALKLKESLHSYRIEPAFRKS